MNDYKKLALIPSEYYDDMPFTKYKAAQIIKQTKCRKKQFKNDEEFKCFLKVENAKSYIPLVIEQCKLSDNLKKYLINEILKLGL